MSMFDYVVIEGFRRTHNILPKRLFLKIKTEINQNDTRWGSLGIRQCGLQGTPYQIKLDLGHYFQRWTYIRGHYDETHLTTLLQQHLNQGDCFVDVGANIGAHVLYAASQVGMHGQIIAFEPNPHSYARLRENINLNQLDWVVTHQVALGREPGVGHLNDCDDTSVMSHLRQHEPASGGCDVPIERGDDVLQNIPQTARGICKIDVEGFELVALQGMTHFIATHPKMAYIVEITTPWVDNLGGSAQDIFDLFATHGFAAQIVHRHDGSLEPLDTAPDKFQYEVWFTSNQFN